MAFTDIIDMTGRTFGRLTARWPSGIKYRYVWWLCSCTCGNLKIVRGQSLRNGHTKSCGCFRTKHGNCHSPEYKIWDTMIQRCTNPKNGSYKNYGKRGIKVCVRWKKSFSNFLADMGRRPSGRFLNGRSRYSIDRRNNDGNYTPKNCRWTTAMEQARNSRRYKNQ